MLSAHVRHRVLPLVVGLGLLVLGCAAIKMYPGPELPPEKVAVLEIGNVKLFTLDGAPVELTDQKRRLQILPGEHVLRATHNRTGFEEKIITYTFSAESGHAYRFDVDYDIQRGLSWVPWVKDSADGKIIGGWK